MRLAGMRGWRMQDPARERIRLARQKRRIAEKVCLNPGPADLGPALGYRT